MNTHLRPPFRYVCDPFHEAYHSKLTNRQKGLALESYISYTGPWKEHPRPTVPHTLYILALYHDHPMLKGTDCGSAHHTHYLRTVHNPMAV